MGYGSVSEVLQSSGRRDNIVRKYYLLREVERRESGLCVGGSCALSRNGRRLDAVPGSGAAVAVALYGAS